MAQRQSHSGSEAPYTRDELVAEAASFGLNVWDVYGIFASAGVTDMTEREFLKHVALWRGEKQEEVTDA